MRVRSVTAACFAVLVGVAATPAGIAAAVAADDPTTTLVARLDFARYKATIKGLTQFGDRREGTARNRSAIDWIEAQLKASGCTNTERLQYQVAEGNATNAAGATNRAPAGRAGANARAPLPETETSVGGGRPRGRRNAANPNTDPNAQPNQALRQLDAEVPTSGPREEVYCTKIGTTHPDEMYILGAHMDGRGFGEAANDDGSGTALVMELARIFSAPDVQTERSIRFILWNNEEGGLRGSAAYVAQRRSRQGIEEPPGSGKYPEPRWLGMIQHDMMLFDHGMPRADGTVGPEQRPEADINVEFQISSKLAAGAQALAWKLEAANEQYATDYPVTIGSHMTNTDSDPFKDLVPAISVRENERGTQIGSGWDPQWHQPTDLYTTYADKDFRLGLNATQTTLSALSEMVGVSLRK